jgi:hypothetical protein
MLMLRTGLANLLSQAQLEQNHLQIVAEELQLCVG